MGHSRQCPAVSIHHTGTVLLFHFPNLSNDDKACCIYKDTNSRLFLRQSLLQCINALLPAQIQCKDLHPASQKLLLQLLQSFPPSGNDPELMNAWIILCDLNCKLPAHPGGSSGNNCYVSFFPHIIFSFNW